MDFALFGPILAMAVCADSRASDTIEFNRDVRPILAQYCFKCHGADENSREAKLRLDVGELATGVGESGRRAIVPGKLDESEVIRRIFSHDDDIMPPVHTKSNLPDSAKAILKQWIADGAVFQQHWAYVAPKQIPLPQPSGLASDEISIHPIDTFIRSRLSSEGLVPSPQADRYTLVRRLYLDLIGLPPTPQQADDFVHDNSPDAYERVVDLLLRSEHYGQRWARRWLDLARYADTNGFEKDRTRTIWPYRDWVVKALNDDLPYDQFSIKQLAGDLMPNATPDDWIATGFHRNTMLNEEGGIDPLEYRFYAMVDRVGVTGTTWLGLTLNCAQCHTHKYDPLQHADFYRLMALLNNADEPTYFIPDAETEAKQREHLIKIANLEAELASKFPGGEEAIEKKLGVWIENESKHCSHWEVLTPTKMKTTLPHLVQQPDGFILASGDITKSDVYEFELKAPLNDVRALRIEVASHPSLPNDGPGLTNYEGPIGGFFLSELQAVQNGQPVLFSSAAATNEEEEDRINDGAVVASNRANSKPKAKASATAKADPAARKKKTNSVRAALDGEMSSGWQVLGGYGVRHAAVFHFEKPIDVSLGLELRMLFEKHFACPLGYFRISVATNENAGITAYSAEIEELLSRPREQLSSSDKDVLRRAFLESSPELEGVVTLLESARKRPPRGKPTLVMRERPGDNPRKTHRYHRGEFLQPREEVAPGVPNFLPPLAPGEPANRLTFAKWLFSPNNPLTARVAVNRQWQAFFGRGLVKSLDDFGYQSQPPSHPELLDWLALEFIRKGWSMKALHRLIVTSATYKQSSRISPELARRDPENLLLARGPRFRLDAEIIRDSALSAAGILSTKMGGPGVYPPQPASVTTEGTYGKVEWKASEGEDRFRRSLYTFMKRTAPFAMASAFDAPSGESCLARRDVSNSPLQALTLLNDQMFLEAAQAMARQVMIESTTDQERLENIYRRCLTRHAADDENKMLLAFVELQRQQKLEGEALWTAVSRAVLNLDEAITHP